MPAARQASDEVGADVVQGRAAGGDAEVALQVDAAQCEVGDPRFGGDGEGVEDAAGAFDGAQQWFAGGAFGDPADVGDGFDLGDADAVGCLGDGGEVGGGEAGAGGVDPDPGGVVAAVFRPPWRGRGVLASGGTASSRSRMTASAPASKTLASSLGLCPGANR